MAILVCFTPNLPKPMTISSVQVFFVFAIPGTGLTLAHPTTRYRRAYARSKFEPLDCLARTFVNSHSRPTTKGSGNRQEDLSNQQFSQNHFATVVRVPGSLGALVYHRESPDEEVQAGIGLGNEASADIGSPLTSLSQERSTDRQSFKRSSTDGTEGGLATDLEEKPQPPPQVPSGTPASCDSHQNPLDESPPKAGNVLSQQPSSSRSTVKKKPARSKS
ncbi:hypothetical protein L914_17813 [Phytophthora nicotianae]|uniref:Uncharacterized protein n=2 Tax=Phytophthora nicotianae TaxID=4792 RepID=V9E978_PHYNI|nr:hypothetical protein F443_18521 [Phytophthora nicotianae P1569]ETM35254.1 hypothetical protein L914_17813 [Phytophthora nicotianae]